MLQAGADEPRASTRLSGARRSLPVLCNWGRPPQDAKGGLRQPALVHLPPLGAWVTEPCALRLPPPLAVGRSLNWGFLLRLLAETTSGLLLRTCRPPPRARATALEYSCCALSTGSGPVPAQPSTYLCWIHGTLVGPGVLLCVWLSTRHPQIVDLPFLLPCFRRVSLGCSRHRLGVRRLGLWRGEPSDFDALGTASAFVL